MSGAVKITRVDLSAAQLRKLSKKEKNPLIVRRMLAIALVLEGTRRRPAAEACGMDRQTLRDWVHHYNKQGIAGLGERRTSGNKSPLGEVERKALVELLEKGPDPALHGVVGWRRVDLQKVLKDDFNIKVHERSVGRYLAELGYRRLSVRPQHPEADLKAQEAFKKTSPTWWQKLFPKKRRTNPLKSGSKMKPASANKEH